MNRLECLLRVAALAQLVIAGLNLGLVRIMKWQPDLQQLPPLLRQVFVVHLWFISITLTVFAAFTWKFAPAMAAGSNPASVWLGGAIGLFWGIRAVLQVAYYSRRHWQGQAGRTGLHYLCLAGFGSLSAVYWVAALRSGR